MEAGLPDPFFALLGTKHECYLTDSTMLRLLRELKTLGLNIHVPHWRPPPGKTVTAEFSKHANNIDTLQKLNTCRLISKVHYIADMVTLDG